MFRITRNVVKSKEKLFSCEKYLSVSVKKENSSVVSGKKNKADDLALPYTKVPGPSALPLFGSIHHFLPRGKLYNIPLNDMQNNLQKEYGDIVKLAGLPGKQDMVFTFNADDIEKVYRTEGAWPHRPGLDTVAYHRRFVRPEVYGGVIGVAPSQGEEWGKIRSQVNPSMMQPRTSKQYLGVVDEVSLEFINRIRKIVDENGVTPDNFSEELNRWALESIGRIALDAKLGILKDELQDDSPPKQIMTAMREFLVLSFELDFQPSIWRFIKTPKFKRCMKALDVLTNNGILYVDQAIKRFEEKSKETVGRELSILEKLYLVDKKVAYITAIDMLIAGVDTTATSTSIALYYLAINPDKQEILRKEITDVLPNKNEPLTNEHMLKFNYLRAALKESSRLTPIAVGNIRRLQQDTVLGGYVIPKGTDVVLTHAVQSNKATYFPQPERFLPERWLRTPKDSAGCPVDHKTGEPIPSAKEAHPFAHMPFGFGARMCVGKRFADLEMQILLCNIIRNFKIEWMRGELQFNSRPLNFPVGPLKYKFIDV